MENKANHCVYNINYHIVFCPKYRRKVINGKVEEIINQTVGKICESYGFSLIQMGTMPDHLHILLYAPPTVAPAEIVKTLKSITANTVFKTIPGIKKRGKFIVPNTENVAENLWRGAGRATTRALYRVDPERNRDINKLSEDLNIKLVTRLQGLAAKIPEDVIGQPPLAALPDEVKMESREIADWILQQNGAGLAYESLVQEIYGEKAATRKIGILRDKIAEKVAASALQLLPREMPNIEIRVHQGRLHEALSRLCNVDGKYICNDLEEAEWTAGTMYRVLVRMGTDREEARNVV